MNESGRDDSAGALGDSDDSDEDTQTLLAASWESLSIMERLGLKSSVEMTEEEVESAFTQIAVGFHCDQYTLTQRLQAERHERCVAEENLQRELRQSREMLQVLYERLHEADSKKMVQQMENNLQMLESNMDNVLKTAEMLGAAHQEARVSHAVELMSVHMEHLKRRHATESEEMLEVRKLLHRRKGRLHSDSTDDRELFRYSSQQVTDHPTRRRVSITFLPTQSELKHLEASFLENCKASLDAKDRRQEVVPDDSPASSLNQDDDSSVFQSPTQITSLRHRRRYSPTGRAFKGEESKRGEEPNRELCLAPLQRPLLSWRSTCGSIVRMSLLVFVLLMLMLVLLCVVMSVCINN
ncbi:lymphoid-restricted membrane protein isoform X1 [Carassius auratus]|uniref:Lymphoid-restricted membrane protein-like isoform X1 n=1 Tax=Carassius auratus TaxID=7957 RepID=A0A6P6J2T5_CARAU|nr:lymphoid-restricted membrane protein-like isoform X1 [Carassius auratus]XP_026054486.1 lymphoid-restricted membrane protein-like isoform X1 [Carassius auratus]